MYLQNYRPKTIMKCKKSQKYQRFVKYVWEIFQKSVQYLKLPNLKVENQKGFEQQIIYSYINTKLKKILHNLFLS